MPAVGHGEKGRLGTAIESSGDLGPPSPRRPDPERSLPALLPGSPSDSCSPLYRRGTGGEGGRGGASARKSRPHPLSAGPPGHSPLCHAPPLARPVFVFFFSLPLRWEPFLPVSPCSFQLQLALWLGSLSFSTPGPRSRPLCQSRIFPVSDCARLLFPRFSPPAFSDAEAQSFVLRGRPSPFR